MALKVQFKTILKEVLKMTINTNTRHLDYPFDTQVSTPYTRSRRGGRVAEGAPLLREYTLTRIVGSNPILSANHFSFIYYFQLLA